VKELTVNPDLLKLFNPDGRTTQERIDDELSKRRARYERRQKECRRAATHSQMRRTVGRHGLAVA